MFTKWGITKQDFELLANIVLTVFNVYWTMKLNSIKYHDEMLRDLQEQNQFQEMEIQTLRHQSLVHKIRKRKTEAKLA